jgi:hypothetical protein
MKKEKKLKLIISISLNVIEPIKLSLENINNPLLYHYSNT